MRESQEVAGRREFLKDGLRALLVGGLIILGSVLGLKKKSGTARVSSCPGSLPCRDCSKLQGCGELNAFYERRNQDHSRPRSVPISQGVRIEK